MGGNYKKRKITWTLKRPKANLVSFMSKRSVLFQILKLPNLKCPCLFKLEGSPFEMSTKKEKGAVTVAVVELDSSDDENAAGAARPNTNNASSKKVPPQVTPQAQRPQQQSPAVGQQALATRSFWKAGEYVVGPSKRPAMAQGQLEHARVHPKFLHSNATSHKWAFGGKACACLLA